MKHIVFLGLLTFFTVSTFAQSWEKLNTDFFTLYDKEEFSKAAIVGEKLVVAAKNEFGEWHVNYASSLHNLAAMYLEMAEYKKAEPLLLQSKKIWEKISTDTNPDYVATLSDLGTLYQETKQYSKAEPLYLQVIAISKKNNNNNGPEYITTVSNLAVLYEEMKLFEKAEPLYLEAHEFYTKHPGENDYELETSLLSLATLYDKMGQVQKAVGYYLPHAEIIKKNYGEVSNEYTAAINKLALAYSDLGEFEKAEPLYLLIVDLRYTLQGEKSAEYASALGNLASHYYDMGLYDKAAFFFNEAIRIAGQNPDKTNTDYVTFVNNLAILYMQTGKYDFAEPLLLKVKETYYHIFGENDPSYATALSNLGTMYFNTGQYDKAEPLFIEALRLKKKLFGEENVGYAATLSNLGLLYTTIGEYKKAEPLYIQAKVIRKKTGTEKHPDYAALLDNMALLYTNIGENTKVEPLYVEAKEIRKQLFGEMHPDYATSLNNLAYYYMEQGMVDTAEKYFLQAKEIIQKTLGEDNPRYSVALNNLARLYMLMEQYKKATPYLKQSGRIVLQNMFTTFSVLSENEKNNFLKKNTAVFETNNSFLYQYKNAPPEFVKTNFNLQLLLKSASLADTKNMMASLINSTDTSIRKLFTKWIANRNILARQFSLPLAKRRKDLDAIKTQTEADEKDLNMLSSEFRHQQTATQDALSEVQKNLQADEAVVEFVRFELLTKNWTDSVMYSAYVVRKNDTAPVFIPLCEEKQLQQVFDSAGKTATAMVNVLYRGIKIENKSAASLGTQLYNLIWAPLEPYLKGIKKIDYSPAGKLYSVAFHALQVDSATVLLDKYQLEQYTSTRLIAFRHTDKPAPISNIILFGGASFTMDSLRLTKQKNTQLSNDGFSTSIYMPQNRGAGQNSWGNLPGTVEEVKKINRVFADNKISSHVFIQTAASEENLKAVSGHSPQILHIATHGFFLPDPQNKRNKNFDNENAYSLAEDPLLRSGLILAGGNYAWSGKTPIDGVEDGIATAYEISQLNLSNTELVVLSACETALGDVKGSEGVFGLQRAFKMAGAKKLIVSLWQVPDKETAELMTTFYGYWMKGKSINESFYQAQADMRKKYSPFYWAAFVLVE